MPNPTPVSERVARRVGVQEAKPRRSRKEPGLLHGPIAVSVEVVTPAMKKPCFQCGDPVRSTRRLVARFGAGRYAKTEVRCEACGLVWLQLQHDNYGRALAFLQHGQIPASLRRRPDLEVEGIRD